MAKKNGKADVIGVLLALAIISGSYGVKVIMPESPTTTDKYQVESKTKTFLGELKDVFLNSLGITLDKTQLPQVETSAPSISVDTSKINEAANGAAKTIAGATQQINGVSIAVPDWDFNTFPNYYTVVGASGIDTKQFPAPGTISYGNLDQLGRSTTAKGSLTFKNVSASYGVRQQFTADDDPSGWHNNTQKTQIMWLNGKSYNGYFWNRSHLIGDALGGDAVRQNVITGTRPQNVGGTDNSGGMRYSEKRAQEWIESHKDGVLYYQAQPMYQGNEVIPKYVIVAMKSSDGRIDEMVVVYNTANGYNIDYNTSEFTAK